MVRDQEPFDETGGGTGMDTWLATKILQVNSIGYTVRDALKLVADFEGAHTSDQLPAFVAVGVKPDDMDKGASKRYRNGQLCLFWMFVLHSAGRDVLRTVHSPNGARVDSKQWLLQRGSWFSRCGRVNWDGENRFVSP